MKTDITPVKVFWFGMLALAIIYLISLNVVPIHATQDECRRALVPMEMCLTGDFLTPTINGEVYLNKPPLFSWIIAGSYSLFGSYSPFALRFPVVISILLHGFLIFYVLRKYTTDFVACMTALAFMTNWRTLTLDSMLGLLEHTLALMMYAGFMIIYILGERKKYLGLFIVSYFIAALGFLIKGLPAVAHHGIALIVYFLYAKKFRVLFSVPHVLGIVVFILTCASYYIPFITHNQIGWNEVFGKLFFESSKRYEFSDASNFISVLFDYPIDFIKHFLPWTLLIIVFIQKNSIHKLGENRLIMYSMILFLANTPVYWLASLKNPHYLFFLLPLLFAPAFYLWEKLLATDWQKKCFEIITGILIIVIALVAIYAPFSPWIDVIEQKWKKSFVLVIFLVEIAYYYFKIPTYRMYLLVGTLVMLRLAFNWFVLPQRVADQMVYPNHAKYIVEIVQDKPLYINASYPAGYYDAITFPIEQRRNELLTLKKDFVPGAFYLVDKENLNEQKILYAFDYDYADNHEWYKKKMYLVAIDSR